MTKRSERSMIGRLGAHRMHAMYDSKETTAKGREAFMSKFEREVDPDGTLPPDERQRRAEHLRKAYFTELALKSVQSRARKKQQ